MKWGKVTAIFILVTIVAIAVYDVIVINMSGPDDSISQVIIDWSYRFPIFTFSMGIVMGHLFWQMSKNRKIAELQARVKELEDKYESNT
jgi:hypothetical protein